MTNTRGKATKRFTDEERAAMRERAQEQKVATRRGGRAGKADGESDVLAKIAEMPEADRAIADLAAPPNDALQLAPVLIGQRV